MIKSREIMGELLHFEEPLRGFRRYFSGGNLADFDKCFDRGQHTFDKTKICAEYPQVFVHAENPAVSSFANSAKWAIQHAKGSLPVVITGLVLNNAIKTTGGMGDEVDFISGPVPVDRIYLIHGGFHDYYPEDITGRYIEGNAHRHK